MSQEATNLFGQRQASNRDRRPWRPPNRYRGRGRGGHRSGNNSDSRPASNTEANQVNPLQDSDAPYCQNRIDQPNCSFRDGAVEFSQAPADTTRSYNRPHFRNPKNSASSQTRRGGKSRQGRVDVAGRNDAQETSENIQEPGNSQVNWQPRRGRVSNSRYLNEFNINRVEKYRSRHEDSPCSSKQVIENSNQDNATKNETLPTDDKNFVSSCIQSEIAESQFKSNDFECMICCDNIRKTNPIWCCGNCYNIFHLKCAVEWCDKSIRSRNEALANAQYPSLGQPSNQVANHFVAGHSSGGHSEYQAERSKSTEWPCPTCREIQFAKPDKYKCFCGKVVRPDVNRHLTPHSCGQLCGRTRPNDVCPHKCNSICHPGRCAPCLLTSKKPCYCGKLIREIKCSSSAASCGEICAKPLPCGRHSCNQVCHSGPCEACNEVLTIICNCGQQVIEKLCTSIKQTGPKAVGPLSCGKICGKLLDCGNHHCDEPCHSGPNCKSCKLLSSNLKTCPCGSTVLKKSLLAERKYCTDPIPTCDSKCNAILKCGPEKNHHKCQKKCHTGSCPPCKLTTPVSCECKLTTKTVACSLMYEKIVEGMQVYFKQINYTFSCETRCNAHKNCGRHTCNIKCCKYNRSPEAEIHTCDRKCNKKLPCGLHSCTETCHPGQCGDCTNIGWEELTCHCGLSVLYPPIPCGERPPVCHRPCRRAHNCGHPVTHECHDDTEKCAPCIVFVKKSCFCGADSKNSVYCYLAGYSCGRTCKKVLKCGKHVCKRICHENECETSDQRGIICCTQPCPVPRYSCKHPCGLLCHGSSPCMPSECKRLLEITCECGNKKERRECHKVMRDVDNRNKVAMLSTSRSNQDSIIIDLSNKPSSKPKQDETNLLRQLDCDESCALLKRNKALAEALDIAQPDLKPTSIFGEDPLRLLKEATIQDYKFVAATYNSLARFVKSAKDSDKRFIFMQFPPSSKLRREVIHELAHHFNCPSESRDDEPFRHVVVKAHKNKSCVPDFSIEQLLPVVD